MFELKHPGFLSHFLAAVNGLQERERDVLVLYYGLTSGTCNTLEEIGKKFSVSRERIRQIRTKGIRKIRIAAGRARKKNLSNESVLAIDYITSFDLSAENLMSLAEHELPHVQSVTAVKLFLELAGESNDLLIAEVVRNCSLRRKESKESKDQKYTNRVARFERLVDGILNDL